MSLARHAFYVTFTGSSICPRVPPTYCCYYQTTEKLLLGGRRFNNAADVECGGRAVAILAAWGEMALSKRNYDLLARFSLPRSLVSAHFLSQNTAGFAQLH